MSYQLPERPHLVQKAIDFSKLSKKTQAKLLNEEAGLSPKRFSHQRKYDGCHVIIIVEPCGVFFFSRDGREVKSLGHLYGPMSRMPHGVYFAEAWRPNAEHRTINGEFRRQYVQEQLTLQFFDCVDLNSFLVGYSSSPYKVRREHLVEALYRYCASYPKIMIAQNAYPWEAAELASHDTDAYDGLVAWDNEAPWTAGSGKDGQCLKVKNIVDLDLEVITVYEGEGKHAGRLGAIGVRFDGDVELRVGTGFSDLEREAWWRDPLDIKGRIVRIVGMKDSGKGSIREPRFKGICWDKTEADH